MKKIHTNYYLWVLLVGLLCNSSSSYSHDRRAQIFLVTFDLTAASILGFAIYALVQNEYAMKRERQAEIDEVTQTPLPFDEIVAYLQYRLQGCDITDLNIPIIAAQISTFSKQRLERFVNILQITSYYDSGILTQIYAAMPFSTHNLVITMPHFRLALDRIHGGYEMPDLRGDRENFNTAVHEAGHAIAIMYSKQFILHHVSIVSRKHSGGRNLLIYPKEMTLDLCKNEIVIDLAGGVAEQTFGFDTIWNPWHCYCKSDKNEKEIDLKLLSKNSNISEGLANLFLRPSASIDMINAYTTAACIVAWQGCKKDSPDFQNQICKLLEECYQQTTKLIKLYKSKVERVAKMLTDKKIMSGSELYAALHIQRPLYEFETKNQ